jgi:hypothetical protein
MRRAWLVWLLLGGWMPPVMASSGKKLEAVRLQSPIVIDGVLDEAMYRNGPPATDFVQLQPWNGKPAQQPTKVWIGYDQTAIYLGAMLYDTAPDSIANYLSERDDTGTSDFFGVYLDPYGQGQVAYGFFVTPAGVQMDLKAVKNIDGDNESTRWDAVWESQTQLTDSGWVVEMRIPFSALRFSEKAGVEWGLNLLRNSQRYNSKSSWSFVDRNVSGFIHQQGMLSSIKDVKPPVRLSFTPYVSTYIETKEGETRTAYKGGLDLKYGINESYTLDMMLIPDFGQVQSDDKELNLSPYELYYNEKRQFFTEGTELFDRAGVFYSRRIGDKPSMSASDHLRTDEKVLRSPSETPLINATKISGRGSSGWGFGLLNAVSMQAFATVRDTLRGTERKVRVQPATDYSVIVADKSLKNNSFVSFINTHLLQFDAPFVANVLATEFAFRNASKTWSLTGKAGCSSRGDSTMDKGYAAFLSLNKDRGRFHFGFNETFMDDRFNPNDMGYLSHNNQLQTDAWVYYQVNEPRGRIREFNLNAWVLYAWMYRPLAYAKRQTGYNANVTFTDNTSINVNGGVSDLEHNYYETRTLGWFYADPAYHWHNFNLSTDSRKAVSSNLWLGGSQRFGTDQWYLGSTLGINWKYNRHWKVNYSLNAEHHRNERGYFSSPSSDSILFSKREVHTLSNVVSVTYVLNKSTSCSVRVRHYWSASDNKSYWMLSKDGGLSAVPGYKGKSPNYTVFSVDSYLKWVFAPGSELILAWKDMGQDWQDAVVSGYWRNVSKSWERTVNSLSLKVLYYLDYNSLRGGLHQRTQKG